MMRTAPPGRDPDLAGRRVLVVGLGRSGLAAARLLTSRAARVSVSERRAEQELGAAADEARALGAEIRAGGHHPDQLDGVDLVVVSPGVDPASEIVRAARDRGLPVWGEVELAARHCRGRVIGITGSNGKSTVTAMVGTILRAAGVPGGTGGNLATPFCDLLEHDAPDAVHAVELSSFQLETVESLRPTVAVILNLSPDHLDRHRSYDEYARAKARLLEVQQREGFAVLNADDGESRRFLPAVRGELHTFSTRREIERGACLRGETLVVRGPQGERAILDAAQLPLPGEHNVANALAAALSCTLIGRTAGEVAAGLRSFRALPHRLQRIASVGGVAFYDDSKATNPASTLRALDAFAAGRVHLILGGLDKGADWSALVERLAGRARRVLLVGSAAGDLRRRIGERVPTVDCGTVAAAVRAGAAGAVPGDVVLLSPGCASFDQYRNFEERGDDFRRAVEALGGEDGDA